MNRRSLVTTFLLVLAALFFTAALWPSQAMEAEHDNPPSGREFISRFDKDGDGRVSREEFVNVPENHFKALDLNNDGYIDLDEAPKGPPKNPVAIFDKDGDGKLSMEEFPGPDEHFTRFDKNGDGYLDESEAPKGPPRRGNTDRGRNFTR